MIDVASELKELLDGCFEHNQLDNLMSMHFCDGEDVTGSRINHRPKNTKDAEPKYKQFATVDSRVKSFKGAPKIPQRRQLFAEAGFFYMGVKDHVQCFCCGGTLRDWKKGLDPFYEHAGWYRSCCFIKAVKGQEFVESCGKSPESFMPYIQQAYPV